jgi:hypothetical protein
MSEFRVEKRREAAELTLVTGTTFSGVFFATGTMLVNRTHVLKVALPPQMIEAQLDAGYDVATRRRVHMLLTTGDTVVGNVVVFRPPGRDRLSDYARIEENFRYLELEDRTLLVNSAHIVALTEVTS